MTEVIKMPGTVRSVNGIKPDENANVTIQMSILQAYPVGSIYMSVVGTDPAELFGGTWEAIAPGRVLIGAGEYSSSVSYQAGTRGGVRERTLKESNIPKHTHTVEIATQTQSHKHKNGVFDEAAAGAGPLSSNYGATKMSPTATQHVMAADSSSFGTSAQLYMGYTGLASTSHTHDVTVGSYGSDNPLPISVMQPYLVVYMWKRTA